MNYYTELSYDGFLFVYLMSRWVSEIHIGYH